MVLEYDLPLDKPVMVQEQSTGNHLTGILTRRPNGLSVELRDFRRLTLAQMYGPVVLHTDSCEVVTVFPRATEKRWRTIAAQLNLDARGAIVGKETWETNDKARQAWFSFEGFDRLLEMHVMTPRNREERSRDYGPFLYDAKVEFGKVSIGDVFENRSRSYHGHRVTTHGIFLEFDQPQRLDATIQYIECTLAYFSLLYGRRIRASYVFLRKHSREDAVRLLTAGVGGEPHRLYFPPLVDFVQTKPLEAEKVTRKIYKPIVHDIDRKLTAWLNRLDKWKSCYLSLDEYYKRVDGTYADQLVFSNNWLESIPDLGQKAKTSVNLEEELSSLLCQRRSEDDAKGLVREIIRKVRNHSGSGETKRAKIKRLVGRVESIVPKRNLANVALDNLVFESIGLRGKAAHSIFLTPDIESQISAEKACSSVEVLCLLLALVDLGLNEFEKRRLCVHPAVVRLVRALSWELQVRERQKAR